MGAFEKLDLTSDATKQLAAETADKLGMKQAWEDNQGTGFVLVFNKSDPSKYERLKGSTDAAAYEALFKKFN